MRIASDINVVENRRTYLLFYLFTVLLAILTGVIILFVFGLLTIIIDYFIHYWYFAIAIIIIGFFLYYIKVRKKK